MHKRPSLVEALDVLKKYQYISNDCLEALQDYNKLKQTNEFQAARMVVDIVDHFYHTQSVKNNEKRKSKL